MTQTIDYGVLLAQGSKAKAKRSPISLLFGEKKIGKTTFAAAFPGAAFLCGEDGAHSIADVRYPSEGVIESWDQLLNYTRAMAYGPHNYKTLVADTLGPLSTLCLEATVRASGKPTWEKMGWGKEEDLVGKWRMWTSLLEHCRNKRGMSIVLLAHAVQAGIQDSQLGEKYYTWVGDMHRAVWNMTSNWVDLLMYAAKEKVPHDPGEKIHTRVMVKEKHWIYTRATTVDGGFEAGVRGGYRLPAKLELLYEAFNSELNDTSDAVVARIKTLITQVGDAALTAGNVSMAASKFVDAAGGDIGNLKWIEKKLQELKK
jgi:hypothetical protein